MAETEGSADAGSAYLEQLQLLASEIQAAIEAVATHSLAALEASVARQEQICAALSKLAEATETQPIDVYLREHIRSAAESVRRLNMQYGALLRHSSRSIALLTALCRNGAGETEMYPVPAADAAQAHTFSLEI